MQGHGATNALELDRADLPEGDLHATEASTTSWLTSTSPGRAYSAIREATFTVCP